MNNRNAFRAFAATMDVAAIGAVVMLIGSAAANAQGGGSCSASSFLGISTCQVTCPVGTVPHCTSGFLSTSCQCDPLPPAQAPRPFFALEPLTPTVLSCANSLIAYLRGLGTDEALSLANSMERVVFAHMAGDPIVYSDAENFYVDDNADNSPWLQEQIQNWQLASGAMCE